MPSRAEAHGAAEALSAAVERENFLGWDPYDALASPGIRAITRTPVLRQAAIQAVKVSPINPRRILRVPRTQNAKAIALFASAYARLALEEQDGRFRSLALELADRLVDRALAVGEGVAWGYPFDVQTRWGFYPRTQPNAVVTSFAAHALMDIEDLAPSGRFIEAVDSALVFARSSLLVGEGNESFFAYYQGSRVPIHNANLLAASLFARRGRENEALPALNYSLARQRPDGSWPYGEGADLDWVDGYHTAFIIWSLNQFPSAQKALQRARRLFLDELLDDDGAVRASPSRRYPIDIHSCASSVWALSELGDLESAGRILGWTLANMRRSDGRFAYQRRRLFRASVPYMRWSDGHMLLALASYWSLMGDSAADRRDRRSL